MLKLTLRLINAVEVKTGVIMLKMYNIITISLLQYHYHCC